MKLIHGDGRDWSDDEVQDALRAHYAPPGDDSYWASLERRITQWLHTFRPRSARASSRNSSSDAVSARSVSSTWPRKWPRAQWR